MTTTTPAVETAIAHLTEALDRYPLIERAAVSGVEVAIHPRLMMRRDRYVVAVSFDSDGPRYAARPRFATREEAEAFRTLADEALGRAT